MSIDYVVKIWELGNANLKKEILYSSQDDVSAMQKASAATPDGCRSTYEVINKEAYDKEKKEIEKEEQAWEHLQEKQEEVLE
jgi:hypothetical protein